MGSALSFSPPSPPSSDGDVVSTASFSAPTTASSASSSLDRVVTTAFDLSFSDAPSGSFFFVARGSSSAGELSVVEAEAGKGGEDASSFVRVEIEVRFKDESALQELAVVSLRKTSGELGVGIYTPRKIYLNAPLYFLIKIILPSAPPAPLSLSSTMFNSPVSILLPSLHLNNLTATTSNAPISSNVEIVCDRTLHLQTSNAPITGDYSAPSISLQTSNQPMTVSLKARDLSITSSNAAVEITSLVILPASTGSVTSPKVVVRSSNGTISSPSFLLSASDPLDACIETSNSPISLAIGRSPPLYSSSPSAFSTSSAPLCLKVVTSNAPVSLKHDGVFDGTIKARTSGEEGVKLRIAGRDEHSGLEGIVRSGKGGDRWDVQSSNGSVMLEFEEGTA